MSSASDEGTLTLSSWQVILLTVATVFPWAIVPICDAIDYKYRTRRAIFWRLVMSAVLLAVSYAAAVIVLVDQGVSLSNGDESIAIIAFLIFNIWYVIRNLRGWLQYLALYRLIPAFEKMQNSVEESLPAQLQRSKRKGIHQMLVSERLVDNEFNSDTPFLNPWPESRAKPHRGGKESKQSPENKRIYKNREIFASTIWRAWWTQDVSILEEQHDLAARGFRFDRSNLHRDVEDLAESGSGTLEHICRAARTDLVTLHVESRY